MLLLNNTWGEAIHIGSVHFNMYVTKKLPKGTLEASLFLDCNIFTFVVTELVGWLVGFTTYQSHFGSFNSELNFKQFNKYNFCLQALQYQNCSVKCQNSSVSIKSV